MIEAGGRLLPVEVNATGPFRLRGARRLLAFREEYGGQSRAGLLIHTGAAIEWLTPDAPAGGSFIGSGDEQPGQLAQPGGPANRSPCRWVGVSPDAC